jgi:hypothetical protein
MLVGGVAMTTQAFPLSGAKHRNPRFFTPMFALCTSLVANGAMATEIRDLVWDLESLHCEAHAKADTLDLTVGATPKKRIVFSHNSNWDHAPVEPMRVETSGGTQYPALQGVDGEDNENVFFNLPAEEMKRVAATARFLKFLSADGRVLTRVSTAGLAVAIDFIAACDAWVEKCEADNQALHKDNNCHGFGYVWQQSHPVP